MIEITFNQKKIIHFKLTYPKFQLMKRQIKSNNTLLTVFLKIHLHVLNN